MKHQPFRKNNGAWSCGVCRWEFHTRPNKDNCPGRLRIAESNDEYKTIKQWKKLGFEPARDEHGLFLDFDAVSCIHSTDWHGYYHRDHVRPLGSEWYLYDINEATPWTAEQLAKYKQDRLRTCVYCGRTVDSGRYSQRYEACKKCVPEAIEKQKQEIQQRKEALEREFQEYLVRSRDEAILWARGLLARTNWVIIDTETTGLSAYYDEVISVTVIDPNGVTLLNTLIKPLRDIPEDATRIHGITDAMVADAPSFAEVFPQICAAVGDRTVVAYNADFDEPMLEGTRVQNYITGLSLPERRDWNCAMLEYAAYVGEWHPYWRSFTWQPLPSGDHSAMGECLATLELIKRMAATKLSSEGE